MPSPTDQRHLPNEITDHIIDHLWDDKLTLAICTHVSKNWLPSVRLHLFRSLVWEDRLEDGKAYGFKDLVKSLESCPAIGSCVENLALVRGADPYRLPEQHPWLCEITLRWIMAKLPRLRSLKLDSVYLGDGDIDPYHDICFRAPPTSELPRLKLDSLELIGVGNPEGDLKRIYGFFHVFESIGRLSIDTLEWNSGCNHEDEAILKGLSYRSPIPSLQISSLVVHNEHWLANLLDHLLPMIQVESVEMLEFMCHDWDDLDAASDLANKIGSNLKALTFNPTEAIWEKVNNEDDEDDIHHPLPQEEWRRLFFRKCSSLQQIKVVLDLVNQSHYRGAIDPHLICYALDIFSECPPTIVHATLRLNFDGVSPEPAFQCIDWPRFRTVLQAWKGLRRVTIYIYHKQGSLIRDRELKLLLEMELKVVNLNDGMLEIIITDNVHD